MIRHRFFLVFCILVFLSGCAEKTPPSINSSGNGGIGGSPAEISRVISAAPSNTEIIAGLGLADRLIAVDKYSRDIPGVQKGLPEIDFFSPDMEAIAGLKPDIIISGEINTGGNAHTPYQFFQRMGIRVIQIPTSNSIEEIYNSIILVAEALGVKEKGGELVNTMREQIAAIASATDKAGNGAPPGAAGRKSVYFEIAPAPTIVSFGRGTYLNELIEIAGGRNIFASEERWFTPGPEAIVRANPDVIFILSGEGWGTAAAELKNRPGFQTLTAVRQNRIYAIDANHASRPSQNIVMALEEMYRAVNAE